MKYTSLPYPAKLKGQQSKRAKRVCYANPPERLSQSVVSEALRILDENKDEQFCNRIAKIADRHSRDTLILKLAAISTLARANGRGLIGVAESVLKWLAENRFSMDEFVKIGTPKDAARLMHAIEKGTERRSQSLISKYLAYHGAGRWMIYDSYVRAYILATSRGLRVESRREAPERRAAIESLPTTAAALTSYEVYCKAIDTLWQLTRVSAPTRARDRESVFWVRAKKCPIYESKPRTSRGARRRVYRSEKTL